MNIWELDKLILFILFVVPGFVSLKTYELIFPAEYPESAKRIIDALSYSCVNYALLSFLIISVEKSSLPITQPFWYSTFYGFVFFISPVIIVFIWMWLRSIECLKNVIHHPIQKPWDFLFSQREQYWVKVTLKNGTVIGGLYAENSFTSSSPAREEIYLEESWVITDRGRFERPKNDTAGIIVLPDEISHMEFRNIDGGKDGTEEKSN